MCRKQHFFFIYRLVASVKTEWLSLTSQTLLWRRVINWRRSVLWNRKGLACETKRVHPLVHWQSAQVDLGGGEGSLAEWTCFTPCVLCPEQQPRKFPALDPYRQLSTLTQYLCQNWTVGKPQECCYTQVHKQSTNHGSLKKIGLDVI